MKSDRDQVSELLVRWRDGDGEARDKLIPMLYAELRSIAQALLRSTQRQPTLQSAALVNEAYILLVGGAGVTCQDRTQFLAVAATVMRRVLIDYARRRHSEKRGGKLVRVTLDDNLDAVQSTLELIALDDALTTLASMDLRQAKIVELRYFGGFSIEDTASALGLSAATVKREWATARMWLQREISRGTPAS
jgi:RNA polymerase sigma factor (TIGR02999 family)